MSKHRLIYFSIACCAYFFSFFLHNNFCFADEKPTVAFKQAKISESISNSVAKQLDLDTLLAEMEASFLSTRKFNVVSRKKNTMEAIREEQQFAQSDLSAGDAAESGQLKNADYLILTEIQRFSFSTKTNKVPNLQSKFFRSDSGSLELNVQVVDTKSGQISATFSLKDGFSTADQMVNRSGGTPDKKNFIQMAKGISAKMADQFLALVFPVEIISVKGDQIYLNRGQDGGFKRGDVLNVYIKGEVLIDPHTGESLGSAEEFIGKIKISRVNPKFTIATTTKDKLNGQMSVGCIIRKP